MPWKPKWRTKTGKRKGLIKHTTDCISREERSISGVSPTQEDARGGSREKKGDSARGVKKKMENAPATKALEYTRGVPPDRERNSTLEGFQGKKEDRLRPNCVWQRERGEGVPARLPRRKKTERRREKLVRSTDLGPIYGTGPGTMGRHWEDLTRAIGETKIPNATQLGLAGKKDPDRGTFGLYSVTTRPRRPRPWNPGGAVVRRGDGGDENRKNWH